MTLSLPALLKANPDLAIPYGMACKLARNGVSGIEPGPGGYGWIVSNEHLALSELRKHTIEISYERDKERT
ncbi:MAG: hypothetical protein AAGF54_06060 [Pseudomonadota bacterium]